MVGLSWILRGCLDRRSGMMGRGEGNAESIARRMRVPGFLMIGTPEAVSQPMVLVQFVAEFKMQGGR